MSIKQKIQNFVSPLYNKVWHGPKGKIRERLKKVCDDMPHKQRLTVVTVLLTAFILIAFFVFGHACYKMGANHAYQQDSQFIEMLTEHDSSAFIQSKKKAYDEYMDSIDIQSDTIAYEIPR